MSSKSLWRRSRRVVASFLEAFLSRSAPKEVLPSYGGLDVKQTRAVSEALIFAESKDWREALAGRPEAKPARRLFADVLIRVKVALRYPVHKALMSEDFTPSNEVACPVCGRPMTFQIIRRAFTEDLYAFECEPCGLSMTEPENSRPPAIVPGTSF